METKIRTRFAPSPTGFIHLGGIRTALFGWLLAKSQNGQFILRIEDTDQGRKVTGSIEHILLSLKSLGLEYDEGPDIGGQYGPYISSQRLAIYNQWAQKLVDKGLAYSDPYSKTEVEEFRLLAKAQKKPFLFRDYRPKLLSGWDKTKALRFKSNPKKYTWEDQIMGRLSAGDESIDDFILIKSDGFPTYNFGHIIDDYLMKISHIIRGQEFIASTPKYLNLYEALEITPPKFVTVPPILGPDGKKKLSKRDNAKDILEYLNEGFLEESLINFISSLGWNDGSTQEIYSIEEIIQKFKLKDIQKSPARFDQQKLIWINGHFIRSLKIDELYKLSIKYLPKEASQFDINYQKNVLGLVQDRLKYLSEIDSLTSYFFKRPNINYQLIKDNKILFNLGKNKLISLLEKSIQELEKSVFSLEDITEKLNNLLIETNQKPVVLFSLIRIAITQSPFSPGLFDTIYLLSKSETILRINNFIEYLKNN